MQFKQRIWDQVRKRIYGHNDIAYITNHGVAMIAYQDERGQFESMLMPDKYNLMLAPGPKDKENKWIYEGDLLTYPGHEGYYLVRYDVEDCAFVAEREDPYNFIVPRIWNKATIAGNIYEDPDLLKKVE